MKRAAFQIMMLVVCLAVCAAAGWVLYTMVAVDGPGAGPDIPVVAAAFGVFGIAAFAVHLTLAALRADDAPRPRGRRQDPMREE